MMTILKTTLAALVLASGASGAAANVAAHVGVLSCDVSAGIGHLIREKQTLNCLYHANGSAHGDRYVGTLNEWGVELGDTEAGHLVWGVVATSTSGVPSGALAGEYLGVSADASLGVGAGANILMGGSHRSFSLQPVSVEGQTGVNIAGGVTRLTLVHAQ
jgi:hypothetical protein